MASPLQFPVNKSDTSIPDLASLKGAAIPKDAAAIILLRQNTDPRNPEVFLVRRSEKLAFLGGFYAFPGGQFDATDGEAPVENCAEAKLRVAITCAAREMFEETGVLLVRGGETLTTGQRQSLLDDLESGRMSWPAMLLHYNLHLDARDFTFVGRWVTPPFSARRFDTWFFLVNCPPKQQPNVIKGELETGEWISARSAHERWQRSEMLAVPPTLHTLKTLGEGLANDAGVDLVSRFLATPHAHGEPTRRIEFRPNYICFPVRTPTKPPATHTNCYLIYTSREILVIDPGSPYEDEQQALAACVDELIAEGRTVSLILLTHLHPDHIGGVNALRSHLGNDVKVAAHRFTAEALPDDIRADEMLNDGETIALEGEPRIILRVMHTPGHARGHVCLHEERTGTLVSGDNIVGLGSVLIDLPEGNMRDYLRSLEKMALPNLSVIFGGHGPAMGNPETKIAEYISHRLEREQKILAAIRDGATAPGEIVLRVYTDVSPKAHPMAERAVLAHLEKLIADGLVVQPPDGSYRATS